MEYIISVIDNFIDYIKENTRVMAGLAIGLLIFIILILLMTRSRKQHVLKSKLNIVDRVSEISGEKNHELRLQKILELASEFVVADGLYLYLKDRKQDRYRLEKVLFKNVSKLDKDSVQINMSYGRIMAYEMETYSPPLVFSSQEFSESPTIMADGRYKILFLPDSDKNAFITISGKGVKNGLKNEFLLYLIGKLSPVFGMMAASKIRVEHVTVADSSQTPLQGREENKKIMQLALLSIGGDKGFFLGIDYNFSQIKAVSGYSREEEDLLKNNIDQIGHLHDLCADRDFCLFEPGSEEFDSLPDILKIYPSAMYFTCQTREGIFLAQYSKIPEKEYFIYYRVEFVKLLMSKMTDSFQNTRDEDNFARQYEDLVGIIRKIDDEEPYSIGYSDLLSRYSSILSRELKLDRYQTQDIATAAFLSNVGVIAIPESILKKKGLYDQKEYEIMKTHVAHGAYIAKLFTGNSDIEGMVKNHHEHVDGSGYPLGLSRDQIGIGSQIICTVQNFLSKIKGRNYREPLPYEKIVIFLNEEAGRSLDRKVVDALINWFRRKQEMPILSGKPLGSCWEIQCSSEDICGKCPAYLRKDTFCWEFPENNCRAHGNNSCATCFVYSEYLQRNNITSGSFNI